MILKTALFCGLAAMMSTQLVADQLALSAPNRLLLRDYHFQSEAEALAYPKNPVDNLTPLARAKVPLFLLCGDADDVVPFEENGAIVQQRYQELGGLVQVLIKKGMGHHPHGLDDPTPVVEFILKASRSSPPADVAAAVRSAVKSGELCFRLSTPAEMKALLGRPSKEGEEKHGNRKTIILEYPGVKATFYPFSEGRSYGLFQVVVENGPVDIGRDRILTLRNVEDLAKFDMYSGVANLSLVRLDLTEQASRLSRLPFSNRTQWPPATRLPKGFDPVMLLDIGKNPGLGVRKLHERGIDGRRIHIAIIDQPLLREHREYKDRIVQYREIDLEAVSGERLHGTAVMSIAVGKTCGTAPAASVYFYGVPTWKWWDEHCKPYAALLDRITEHNRVLPAGQRVRVVSISLGAFSQWPDRHLWAGAVQRARDQGILVVSCDPADLRIGMLKRDLTRDPELAASYPRQLFFGGRDALFVPAGNRTTAYFSGPEDYLFWRDGGLSWTVPYLAGLAALAFQENPDLKPQDIPVLWRKTATDAAAGLVVNPPAFIEAVRKARISTRPVK